MNSLFIAAAMAGILGSVSTLSVADPDSTTPADDRKFAKKGGVMSMVVTISGERKGKKVMKPVCSAQTTLNLVSVGGDKVDARLGLEDDLVEALDALYQTCKNSMK